VVSEPQLLPRTYLGCRRTGNCCLATSIVKCSGYTHGTQPPRNFDVSLLRIQLINNLAAART